MNPSAHTSQERDEALRMLYRLRDTWAGVRDAPPSAVKAIERLIGEYEREREPKSHADRT